MRRFDEVEAHGWLRAALAAAALAAALSGCDDEVSLTAAELQDPNVCADCHPKHYAQWSGSMHAYASDDPVFVAVNRRGQRETNGALGDFCVNCHAPMAKQLGFTDFANFDPSALPPAARGITCYFCHNVDRVTTLHNNGLVLANDQTMRGGLKDPVGTPAHRSKYDAKMDSDVNASELCGSCHDIVVPASVNGRADVPLERTFAEWRETFFSSENDPALRLTCGGCHMEGARLEPIADAPGAGPRPFAFHDHQLAGIDVALTPWPEQEAQAAAVKRILDSSIKIVGPVPLIPGNPQPGGICVTPQGGGQITVRVDSISTGHSWPSGAAQDRRAWLELIAYDAGGQVLFERGANVGATDPEAADPSVFGFWDRALRANGMPAHFFWEVDRLESNLLKAPSFPKQDVSRTAVFPVGATYAQVARVSARFRFNPLPYAMLDALIASGDLAPEIRDRVKTLDVGEAVIWRRETADTALCGPPP